MDIDSDHMASDHSDSSQILYVDDYETLPSSGPATHTHVVDLGDYIDYYKEQRKRERTHQWICRRPQQ